MTDQEAIKEGVGASKLERSVRILRENQEVFQCPLCGGRMKALKSGKLLCKREHAFDLSKKGYVNLLNETRKTQYDKDLFTSRKAIFHDGFYRPVAEEILTIIKEYREKKSRESLRLLDAGCGEGYYSDFLAGMDWLRIFALDLSKEAISLATDYGSPVSWSIGDLARLPFKDRSMDIILDVLTPANYKEFKRVLQNQGLLIKVIPGDEYLQELRKAAGNQLIHKDYSNRETVDYALDHLKSPERKKICYQLPVTREQRNHFMKMTPLFSGVDEQELKAEGLDSITISMEILWGRLS
jgi:23S rRNA (guanine745-N1)-methyltransferase